MGTTIEAKRNDSYNNTSTERRGEKEKSNLLLWLMIISSLSYFSYHNDYMRSYFLKLLYWISHKNRLYICCCSDKSNTSPIKVYAILREIIPEGKKHRGEGKRQGAHIPCMYIFSLGAIVYAYMLCVPLSSSLPHSSWSLIL